MRIEQCANPYTSGKSLACMTHCRHDDCTSFSIIIFIKFSNNCIPIEWFMLERFVAVQDIQKQFYMKRQNTYAFVNIHTSFSVTTFAFPFSIIVESLSIRKTLIKMNKILTKRPWRVNEPIFYRQLPRRKYFP
jgi:hypothetical protein